MGARRQASDGRRETAGPRRSAHDALPGGSQSPPTDFRWQPLGLAADDGPVSRLLQAVATFDRSHPTGAGTPTGRPPPPAAPAAPACARGMPETAVLVIGAFTRPNPAPKTT